MRPRLTTFALVGLGTLIGHAMAYTVPGFGAPTDAVHGYLQVATLAAIPVAVAATIVLLRRNGDGIPRLVELAGYQIAAYALQETMERGTMGISPAALLGDPVLWWGILAQVAVAVLARASLRVSVRLVHVFRRLLRPRDILGLVVPFVAVEPAHQPRQPRLEAFRTRAPPAFVV